VKAYLISVGTKVPTWIQNGFLEFNRRLPADSALQLIELESPKSAKNKSSEERKAEEANLILKQIKAGAYVVALDEKGEQWTSPQFAKKIETASSHFPSIYFIIGGADGLADTLKSRANCLLSFSAFTFPHMMVRVLLAEQWYRAMTLISGHPYHRE